MKILVADDSIVSRHLLNATLTKWGYEVVLAVDGTQAWNILQSPDSPVLAIVDWMMPGLTGPELCRKVRELAKEPYIYIILLTSRSSKEDLIQGMEAGADDYVVKPFDQHELNVRLRAGNAHRGTSRRSSWQPAKCFGSKPLRTRSRRSGTARRFWSR